MNSRILILAAAATLCSWVSSTEGAALASSHSRSPRSVSDDAPSVKKSDLLLRFGRSNMDAILRFGRRSWIADSDHDPEDRLIRTIPMDTALRFGRSKNLDTALRFGKRNRSGMKKKAKINLQDFALRFGKRKRSVDSRLKIISVNV